MYVEGSVGFSLGCEIGLGLVYRSTLIGVGALADKRTFRRFPRTVITHGDTSCIVVAVAVIARVTSRIFWEDLRNSHHVTHTHEKKKSDAPIRDAIESSHQHSARRAIDPGPSYFTPFVADGTRDCPVTRNLHS